MFLYIFSLLDVSSRENNHHDHVHENELQNLLKQETW